MLEKITLHNFQKIKKKTIRFDRVTTIIGDTDKGKSTIIRGLKWVLLNLFDGPSKELIRWDQEFVRGTIVIDGEKITREKGKKNTYTFKGKKLYALGLKKVPEKLADFINVTETNIQSQLDVHFWFGQTAGSISKELNEIVNLGAIDDSLSYFMSEIRKAKIKKDVHSESVKTAREHIKELRWVKAADASLRAIEDFAERINEKAASVDSLALSLSALDKAALTLENASNALPGALKLMQDAQRVNTLACEVESLEHVVSELEKLEDLLAVELPELPDASKLIALDTEVSSLESLLDNYDKQKERSCQLEKELRQLERSLKKCPMCGQTLRS